MKLFLFILLVVGSVGLNQSYAAEQIKCQEIPSKEEVLKLLSFVKNNVLGTVPQFCREKGTAQLSDQLYGKEKELSDFVAALRVIDPKEKNVVKMKMFSLNTGVIETAKFIILKKMWPELGENNRYEVLLSKECGPLGLNRFPLKDNPKKNKNDSPANLKQVTKVCDSDKIEDLAPYFTADVLAETLFNLRRIFPENFPKMVDMLCVGIKNTDEALLKNEDYKILSKGERSIASVEDFSLWLNGLYGKFQNHLKDSSYGKQDPSESIKAMQQVFDKRQENLKLIYETKGKIPEEKNNFSIKEFLGFMDAYGDTIEKKANGIYIMKKGPKRFKEVSLLEEFEKNMQATLQKGKAEGKEEVPLNQGSIYLISKTKDGKLQLKINEKAKRDILEKAREAKIKKDEGEEKIFQHAFTQSLRKQKYEQQELLEGDSFVEKTVLKTAEGFYREVDGKRDKAEKFYTDAASKFGLEIVPGSWAELFYVKVDGDLMLINYNEKSHEHVKKAEAEARKEQGSTLYAELRESYQNTTSDFGKIKDLPRSKTSSLTQYTESSYQTINYCLRKNNCNPEMKQETANILEIMNKVKSSNKESQILYRGTSEMPEEVLNSLKNNPKNFVLDKGFMSTSADLKVAKRFASMQSFSEPGSTFFVIKSSRCVGISKISGSPDEDEFLCPPGMKFNVKRQSPDKNVYILEEVN